MTRAQKIAHCIVECTYEDRTALIEAIASALHKAIREETLFWRDENGEETLDWNPS